jgi:hypothetical protein
MPVNVASNIREASDELLLRLLERTAAVVQPVPAGEIDSFQESRDLLGRQHALVRSTRIPGQHHAA